jgi:hypothetical protein
VKNYAIRLAVQHHRFLFVIATALLGVAGSLLASASRDLGDWMLFIGSGVVMYVADLCGEVEGYAKVLLRADPVQSFNARRDAFDAHAPRRTIWVLLTGCALIAASFV